jgi:superfamily II helicase
MLDDDASKGSSTTDVARSCLKLDSNKQALKLLGGEDKLSLAKKDSAAIKSMAATSKVTLYQNGKQSIPDSQAAGGSSEKSCAICWKVFGILNRKHRCRISKRHVCDDCSTKRLVEGEVESRVSDGQFLLAAVDAGKEASNRLQ